MVKYIVLFSTAITLSGCLGGTVAQQIVRSIATSVADKAMARALDVDENQAYSNRQTNNAYAQTPNSLATPRASLLQPNQSASIHAQASPSSSAPPTQQSLHRARPGPLQLAIANTAFEQAKPIAEPLPQEIVEVESSHAVMQTSQLVRVELFNMLIGEEKNAVYEQARLMGSASLPQKREWAMWHVATGAIQSSHYLPDKKLITFLIPPEFGKLPSGAITMVELASPGELNVARYKGN